MKKLKVTAVVDNKKVSVVVDSVSEYNELERSLSGIKLEAKLVEEVGSVVNTITEFKREVNKLKINEPSELLVAIENLGLGFIFDNKYGRLMKSVRKDDCDIEVYFIVENKEENTLDGFEMVARDVSLGASRILKYNTLDEFKDQMEEFDEGFRLIEEGKDKLPF